MEPGEVAGAAVRPTPRVRARGLSWAWGLGALAFLAVALLVGVLVGPVDLGVRAVFESALARLPFLDVATPLGAQEEAILWELRVPRVVLACLVGGALAASGAAYQGVFRNPLADPYLLGVAAGAGLGATIAIAYAGASGSRLLPLAAFAGASVAVALAYALGRSVGGASGTATLLLAGVTVAAFLTAAQTFVQQQNADTLQQVYSWLLGRLTTAGWDDVLLLLPYVVPSFLVLLLHRRLLDVLAVGEDEAAALGVNVGRVRLVIVVAATVGTAAAVAISGLIGFVGIIVPHAIRLVAGATYRTVLPLSIVVGAGFLVLADVLARTVLSPAELPIGVITAFFGAPFFALVLRTTRTVSP